MVRVARDDAIRPIERVATTPPMATVARLEPPVPLGTKALHALGGDVERINKLRIVVAAGVTSSFRTTDLPGKTIAMRTGPLRLHGWRRAARAALALCAVYGATTSLRADDRVNPYSAEPDELPWPAVQLAPPTLLPVSRQPTPTEDLPKLDPVPPIALSPMTQLTTNVAPPGGEMPRDLAALRPAEPVMLLGDPTGAVRTSAPFYSTPRTADFVNRPLYFEQRATERHGHSFGPLQPVVAGVGFFGTLPILPYKMGAQPAWMRLNTGNGVVVPSDRYTLKQHLRGAATQAGATLGLIYILP